MPLSILEESTRAAAKVKRKQAKRKAKRAAKQKRRQERKDAELREKQRLEQQQQPAVYDCEFGCGFHGLFSEVAAHELYCIVGGMQDAKPRPHVKGKILYKAYLTRSPPAMPGERGREKVESDAPVDSNVDLDTGSSKQGLKKSQTTEDTRPLLPTKVRVTKQQAPRTYTKAKWSLQNVTLPQDPAEKVFWRRSFCPASPSLILLFCIVAARWSFLLLPYMFGFGFTGSAAVKKSV